MPDSQFRDFVLQHIQPVRQFMNAHHGFSTHGPSKGEVHNHLTYGATIEHSALILIITQKVLNEALMSSRSTQDHRTIKNQEDKDVCHVMTFKGLIESFRNIARLLFCNSLHSTNS